MKSILTTLFCTMVALLTIISPNLMAATIDNFSDFNDTVNPTWTHLFNEVGSSGQTWDASTGEYRLKALPNGANVPPAGQLGFVASYTGPVSTDVNVTADIVEPTGSPTAVAQGYLTGVAAHLNGSNAFTGLTGYLFAYNQSGLPGTPRIEITKLRLGAGTSVIASAPIVLDLLNKNYTLSLSSAGDTWTGNVFEVGNGTPVATAIGTDVNSGGVGPFTSGFSGVFGLSGSVITGPVDVTFDNFSTADVPEPATGLLVVFGTGLILLNRRFLRG
jgi:hypothetical protein